MKGRSKKLHNLGSKRHENGQPVIPRARKN